MGWPNPEWFLRGHYKERRSGLKPLTFQYKSDSKGTPHFGLIAEEVDKVAPDLVVRNEKEGPETLRFDSINAMLLNEFLKEHRKVEHQATTIAQQRKDFQARITKLEATVAQQKKGMEVLTASPKEQASQIQKVSALVEGEQTSTANGPQQSVKLQNPPSRLYFTISRHASPRGGFLFCFSASGRLAARRVWLSGQKHGTG